MSSKRKVNPAPNVIDPTTANNTLGTPDEISTFLAEIATNCVVMGTRGIKGIKTQDSRLPPAKTGTAASRPQTSVKKAEREDTIYIEHRSDSKETNYRIRMRNMTIQFATLTAIINALQNMPNIRELCLYDFSIIDMPSKSPFSQLPSHLTTLHLDALSPHLWQQIQMNELINDITPIRHLSLQHNHMGPAQATQIAALLRSNRTIAILNLANNDIGREGAEALAEALKENKCLCALNVSRNKLGDAGIAVLAKALAKYTPNAQDYALVKRKKEAEQSAAAAARLSASNVALASNPLAKRNSEDSISLKAKLIPPSAKGSKPGTSSGKKAEVPAKPSKVVKPVSKSPQRKNTDPEQKDEIELDTIRNISNFPDYVEFNGNTYMLGNRELSSLNVANNECTWRAIEHLISMLQDQEQYPRIPKTAMTSPPTQCNAQGLIRLEVDGIQIPGRYSTNVFEESQWRAAVEEKENIERLPERLNVMKNLLVNKVCTERDVMI